ncbi:MAG: hypothetical protein HQK51_01670 [Oligoflexia bacterium]|nr:hypothetical protein [Oligoflexia bacterium]
MRNMIYLFSFRFLGVQLIVTFIFLLVYTAWPILFPEDFQIEDMTMVILLFAVIYFLIFMSWGITYSNNLNWLFLTPLRKSKIFFYFVKLKLINFIFGMILLTVVIFAVPFITKTVLNKEYITNTTHTSNTTLNNSIATKETSESTYKNNKIKFKKIIKNKVINTERVTEFNINQGDTLGYWMTIISILILLFMCLPSSVIANSQQTSKDKILHQGGNGKHSFGEIIYLFNYFLDFLVKKYFSVLIVLASLFIIFIFRKFTAAPIFVLFLFSTFVIILTINNNFTVLKINRNKFKIYLNAIAILITFSLFSISYILSYKSIKNISENSQNDVVAQINYLGNLGPEIKGNDLIKILTSDISKENFNRLIGYKYFTNNKEEIVTKVGIKKFIENKNEWSSFRLVLDLFDGVIFSEQDLEVVFNKLDEINQNDPNAYSNTLYVVSKIVNKNFSKSEIINYLHNKKDTYQFIGIALSIIYGDVSLNQNLLNLMKDAPFGFYRYLRYAISLINKNDFGQYELFSLSINKKELPVSKLKTINCSYIKNSIDNGKLEGSNDFIILNLCIKEMVLKDKPQLLKYFIQCPIVGLPLSKCAKELIHFL